MLIEGNLAAVDIDRAVFPDHGRDVISFSKPVSPWSPCHGALELRSYIKSLSGVYPGNRKRS